MALRPRNVLSLCAGVGGLELGIALALRLRGDQARGICYVEREAAAAASLVASMEAGWLHPAPVWSDMLTFNARPWRGLVHILASGDPCQDNSVAGKRAGAGGSRFLAPEVCRLAEECRPDVVFRENVPGNAAEQLAAIVPALEGLGYRVAAGIFSSAETGNTMRRERLFIMAERADIRHERGGDAWGRWPGPADNCIGMDGAAGFGRAAWRAEHAGQFGEHGAAKPISTMAHTPRERPGETRDDNGRSAQWAGGAGGELACASDPRSQGQQRGQHLSPGWQVKVGHAGLRSGTILPPAVIPGPTDSRWIDVLDRWPEYQPALSAEEAQSHLRRGIDAMAHRIERLRATGNGVDPITAAYAFLCLAERLRDMDRRPVGLPGCATAWPTPQRA